MKPSLRQLKNHFVLTDENLRNNLIKKGLTRAREFSWHKTAEQTKEIYFKLLESILE